MENIAGRGRNDIETSGTITSRSDNSLRVSSTTSSTTSINQWSEPFHLETNELEDSIEMIYEEVSNMVLSIYPSRPLEKRHFKIVFSCVDGKWNKSERIYGKKIEGFSYFEFD
jgi:hypothetical protein